MNFPFYIAKRYLVSKKSQNAINIISGISIAGITVGTMALIVVLSVFNGFENLVVSLFNSFDSDLKITATQGKTLDTKDLKLDKIKQLPGVLYYSEVLEENALLKYNEKQFIGTIKAVDNSFLNHTGLDSMIVAGDFTLGSNEQPLTLVGQGVAYTLGLNPNNILSPLTIYVPKRNATVNLADASGAFTIRSIFSSGVFSIQQEIDNKYIIVPKEFGKELLEYEDEATSIELGIKKGYNQHEVQKQITEILGKDYLVKNRYQQHELLFKIMKSEKWAIFLILSFILVIATFNVIGSLTMLIIEKKKDMAVLFSMGADTQTVRRIFLSEGVLITLVGALSGLGLGFIICFLQQKYELISLQGSGTFIIEAYPVSMEFTDFIAVFLTVLVIGIIAAIIPSRQLVKNKIKFS